MIFPRPMSFTDLDDLDWIFSVRLSLFLALGLSCSTLTCLGLAGDFFCLSLISELSSSPSLIFFDMISPYVLI